MLTLILVVVIALIIISFFKGRHWTPWLAIIFVILLIFEFLVAGTLWTKQKNLAQMPEIDEQEEIIHEQMDNLKKELLGKQSLTEEELERFLRSYQALEIRLEDNQDKMSNCEIAPREIEFAKFLLFFK